MNRFQDIQDKLAEAELDAILLIDTHNRRFATGFSSSDGAAVVTKDDAWFLTDSRYIEAASQAIQGAEIVQVGGGTRYSELIAGIVKKNGVKRLGFEDGIMTYRDYQRYADALPAKLVPAGSVMEELRLRKTPEEAVRLKKAQEITDRAFAAVLPIISPRMTELELTAELIYHMMKNGGEKASFDPIVVSGENSSKPHGVPGGRLLEGFVTMDFGCIYEGYCSDMTRTVSVGPVTEEMRTVYETVLTAQRAGIAAAKAGVTGDVIDGAARKIITDAGYGDYFGHSFGHSVGLECHDGAGAAPGQTRPLPLGAVISAEPGIYLPGRFGVRIEDVIILTEHGAENITKSPKELIVL